MINTHNTEIIRKYCHQLENNNNNNNNCNDCNWKSKIDCPLRGICNLKNVVYQATIFPAVNVKDF